MKLITKILPVALIMLGCSLQAQEKTSKSYKAFTVAFYNVENLFDTINDTAKNDEASPIMELKANRNEIYKKKVHNMARVLSDVGTEIANTAPAVIGLCEIENRDVIVDLVNDPLMLGHDYGIVHYDSPDSRGIDVGLIYQKKVFTPISTSSHELKIYDDDTRERTYTRDQLLVSGKLDGEMIHFIVNHWPSRRGGEQRSRPKRVAAAALNKHIIDSLQTIDPYAKVIIMGDLNDDPTNASVKDVLKAKEKMEEVEMKGIYNPYMGFFRSGLGTTAYRDAWSLFDQIMLTKPLIEKDYATLSFFKAGIYNKNYLTNKRGRWKGYPLRSFADGGFTGGFSDHFPVYVCLIKEVQ